MLSSFFYLIALFSGLLSQSGSVLLWCFLIVSLGINLYLFKRNKQLKARLKRQQKKAYHNPFVSHAESRQNNRVNDSLEAFSNEIFYDDKFKNKEPAAASIQHLQKGIKESDLSELEAELNDSLWLNEDDIIINQPEPAVKIEGVKTKSIKIERVAAESDEPKTSPMHSLMQSLSGWHKSLVPFLLQNIGWFIGILCFISGSVFFISYTEGFNKSLTIFYTVLTYTLLLAWGGYRLKDKVSHAAMSGYVLMATSFLLIPLNFAAAAQLIWSSAATYQYLISIPSTLIAFGSLYFTSRLISGVFNRQLLSYFSLVFFTLSSLQLVVPWIQNSQSMIILMAVQIIILLLLLWALINYMPAVLKQIFVDRQYLLVMSVGSLIYAALVSTIHITLSSPLSIALSYYAPMVLLISAALFYIDGQLNDYKEQMSLLSRFSFISYAVSFAAIALSLNNEPIRSVTLLMGVILYARLVWLYRSLAPLYLLISLLCFLHFDVVLSDWLLIIPGITSATASQWYYLASLPLLGLFFLTLFVLRKSELQRSKCFAITTHLFHLFILASIVLSTYSQWSIAISHSVIGSGFSIDVVLNLLNATAILLSCYFLLKSKQVSANELLGNKVYTTYCYILLLLPVVQILLGFQETLSIDMKLVFISMVIYLYSINSHFNFMSFYTEKSDCFDDSLPVSISSVMNKELFINVSLLISFFLISLVASGFSVSIKMGLLIFVISLNFLLLSLTLLNRALFYVFMMVVSVSILTFKLYLSHSPSTGLLVISSAFVIFYFIHWLDYKRQDEVELFKLETQKQKNPQRILWFYPTNDFSIQPDMSEEDARCDTDEMEAIKNV